MNDRRLWTSSEDSIINQLVQQHGTKKWTVIATEMSKHFGQQSRTSKQIRQRWYNHLDPQINKCVWSESQQKIIFEAHKIHGSKWKEIAKLFKARTDNSVKNHFYSTLRRSLRRINKFLGFKNSTNQMRVIKPSILSFLVQSNDQESKLLVSKIFQFANYKPNKKNQKDLMSQEEKIKFQSAIQKIISFNNNYQNNKQQIKKSKKSKNPLKNRKSQELQTQQYVKQSEDIQNNLSTMNDKIQAPSSPWEDLQSSIGMIPQIDNPCPEFDFFEGDLINTSGINNCLNLQANIEFDIKYLHREFLKTQVDFQDF